MLTKIMEHLNIIDRAHLIASQLKPLAINLLPDNVQPRLLSIAAQLLYENPELTDEELMMIAPRFIRLPQNQILIPATFQNDASASEVYFATKPRTTRYSEEYYLDDESGEM
jgi:hypothetical protein